MRFETVVVTIFAVGDGRVPSQMVLAEKFKNLIQIWKVLNITATVIAVANIGICDGKFSSQFPSLIKRRVLPSLFAVANMVVTAHCRRQKQRPRPQRRREKCRRHAVAVGLLRRQNDFWRRHFAVANWINFCSEFCWFHLCLIIYKFHFSFEHGLSFGIWTKFWICDGYGILSIELMVFVMFLSF